MFNYKRIHSTVPGPPFGLRGDTVSVIRIVLVKSTSAFAKNDGK